MISRMVALLMMFLVRTALINYLSESYLGVEAVIANVIQLLNITEMGFGTAISYRLYKPIAEKDESTIILYLNFYKKICYLLAALIIVIGFIMSLFLMRFMNDVDLPSSEIFLIFWMNVAQTALSYSLYAHRATIVQADQKMYIKTNYNSIGIIVGSIGQVIAYVFFKSYIGGLAFLILAQIASTLAVAHYAGKHYPCVRKTTANKLDKSQKRSLFKDIYALALIRSSNIGNKSLPLLVVSYFLGAIKSGLYSNYLMIQNAVESILLIAFSSITASVGNLNATSSIETKREAFKRTNFLMYTVLSIAIACICTLTSPFIKLIWGENMLLPQSIVFAICAYLIISGFMMVISTFKEASGIFWRGRYRPVIGVALTLLLSIILVNVFGIAGVVWATAVSRFCTESWFDPLLLFKYSLETSPRSYFLCTIKYVLLIIITTSITYAICGLIPLNGIMQLVGYLALSIILPLAFILILFWKSDDLQYFKNLAVSIISKKR